MATRVNMHEAKSDLSHLVAQAQLEKKPLSTADPANIQYAVDSVW